MDRILKANGIYKSYRMGKSCVEVLKGLDFSVQRGSFVSVVGASGSGKSTMLHILGALDKPDKGSVEYDGTALNRFSSARLNVFRNRTVGFVFQFYHLLDELNVLENVLLPAMASGGCISWLGRKSSAIKKATELLESVGLAQRLKHKPYELSGGERQRVAIARALVNGPEVLLADEPTGNLDSKSGQGIIDILEALHKKGQTIVMVTHDQRIADRTDRVVRLLDGRIAGR